MAVCLAVPFIANAADKKPSASKVLRNAVKALRKAKSYRVEFEMQGGISKTPDHELISTSATAQYQGDYYRGYMNHTSEKVIRTPKTGAIRKSGRWMQMLALPEGVKLSRLFEFPLEVLGDAAAKGATVEWVAGTTEKVIIGKTGHTGVVTERELQPNRIRITLPDEVSLKRYITIQNSGCMSGC